MVPLPLPLDGDGLDGRAPLRTPTTGRRSAAGVGQAESYFDHASGAKASQPELEIVLRMLRKRRHA